jgi:spermidine synthase
MTTHNQGKHVLLDLTYKSPINYKHLMHYVYDLMDYSIKLHSNMKIIHKFKHAFEPPDKAGFSIIFSLDSSHASCHCYSDTGLMSFDVYTCGETEPYFIMKEILDSLRGKLWEVKTTYFSELKRFLLE